jgi:hypothetical protein
MSIQQPPIHEPGTAPFGLATPTRMIHDPNQWRPQQNPQKLEYLEVIQSISASKLLFQVQLQQGRTYPYQLCLNVVNLESHNAGSD